MSGTPRISSNIVIFIATIVIVAVFVFFTVVSEAETFTNSQLRLVGGQENLQSKKAISKEANDLCSNVCTQRHEKRTGGANLLDHGELVQEVSKAKDRLIGKLKIDYGDYFEPICRRGNR